MQLQVDGGWGWSYLKTPLTYLAPVLRWLGHLELDRHLSHTASTVAGLDFLTAWWSQRGWTSQW